MNNWKKLHLDKLLIVIVAMFIVRIISCSNNKLSDEGKKERLISDTIDTIKVFTDRKPVEELKPPSPWTYHVSEDKMTSKQVRYASVSAPDKLMFEFPYNGGSTATLTLRKKSGATDIYMNISEGQFNNTYEGGFVRIRFDKNSPRRYSFSPAADGSSDVIFLDATADLVKRLKKAKKIIIEAEFYNEGTRQIEFDVKELNWK